MGGLFSNSLPAFAVHALQMQLDGNTTAADHTAPPLDWESLFQAGTGGDITPKTTALPSGFLARGSDADYALPEVTTYATGSKDTLDISGWQCGKSNNLGAKDDLVNVYTAAYRNPANHHLILYFGAEKSSNLGDNNIGIWFVQDPTVNCVVPASGKNTTWSGLHQVGDVLLTAAFTNGGTQAAVESHAWTSTGLGAADSGFLCTPPTAAQLADPAHDTSACAITNLSEFSPPWNHPLKTAGTGGALATQEFYEGGVDVTQLEIDSGNSTEPCITTFVADTRSSQSPTATLFDYARGALPVCHPSTTMTDAGAGAMTASPSPALTGQTVTFTAFEKNDGTDPLNPPTAGNTGSFVQSADCSPWTNTAGDSASSGTVGVLDPGETWTFTCSRSYTTSGDKTVTVFGHGLDPNFDNKDVTFCATPDSTKICDADETNSITITIGNPSTALAAGASTPAVLTVHSGDAVTLTWTEANDASGASAVLTPPNPSTPLVGSDRNHFVTADSGCTPAYVSGDTNGNFKLDAGETFTFSCTLSPAVTADTTVTATGHGIDIAGDDVTYCTAATAGKFCDTDERAQQSINVINPSTTMTGTGSALVTLTWTEKNDATVADEYLTPPTAGSNSSFLSANNGCTPASVNASGTSRNIGDSTTTGTVGRMDIGETWTFTCQVTVLPSTPVTVTAVGHGLDSTGADVTICPATATKHVCDADETQSVTITVSQ